MKRAFHLFIATKELLTAPPVQMLLHLHDGHLVLGDTNVVSFTVEPLRHDTAEEELAIEYDPLLLDIIHADILHVGRLLVVTLSIIPRDLGSAIIRFVDQPDSTLHTRHNILTHKRTQPVC